MFLVFLINENKSYDKNNKIEKNHNQRIAEIGDNRSSDSGALQVKKKMLTEKGDGQKLWVQVH